MGASVAGAATHRCCDFVIVTNASNAAVPGNIVAPGGAGEWPDFLSFVPRFAGLPAIADADRLDAVLAH